MSLGYARDGKQSLAHMMYVVRMYAVRCIGENVQLVYGFIRNNVIKYGQKMMREAEVKFVSETALYLLASL